MTPKAKIAVTLPVELVDAARAAVQAEARLTAAIAPHLPLTHAGTARLLASEAVEVVDLDDFGARAAGQLCGATGTSDVIDATVVRCAQARGRRVATSDPDDLRRIDSTLELIVV